MKELPCEADILKYKILSDLEYVSHLKPVPLQFLQTWTLHSDEDRYYKSQVLVTLRNMHTFIKNLKPEVTHNSYLYP